MGTGHIPPPTSASFNVVPADVKAALQDLEAKMTLMEANADNSAIIIGNISIRSKDKMGNFVKAYLTKSERKSVVAKIFLWAFTSRCFEGEAFIGGRNNGAEGKGRKARIQV